MFFGVGFLMVATCNLVMVVALAALKVHRRRAFPNVEHLHDAVFLGYHLESSGHVSGGGHALGALAAERGPLS